MQTKKLLSIGLLALLAGGFAFATDTAEDPGNEGTTVYSVPVTFKPTAEQFSKCTVLDNNGDSKTWTLDQGGTDNACFKYTFSSSNVADDWCFLPPVEMIQGQYKITYTYKTNNYNENFVIFIGQGTEPEGYTREILRKEGYKNSDYVTETSVIDMAEAGEYRIALYAYSDKDMYNIFIKDITIERVDPNAPQIPTAVVTSSGLEGLISITLPTTNTSGAALVGPVNATITLGEEDIPFMTVSGQPGQTVDAEVTFETRGTYTFTIRATVENDGITSVSEPFVVSHLFTRQVPNPLPLDYVIAPDEDDFAACTVINANGDDRTWDVYTQSLPNGNVKPMAFRYNSSYSFAANDWLILPAYEGISTGMMRLNMLVGTKSAREKYEIAVATEPTEEAMTENVRWASDEFTTNDTFTREMIDLPVPAGENFYIGFHITSPSSRGMLFLQDISVAPSSPIVPQSAQFGEVDFDGGDGTIELIFPSKTLLDADIEGTVGIVLSMDGEPYGTDLTGTPGEVRTLSFTGLDLGYHTMTATAYSFDSDGTRYNSRPASITFQIGPGSNFFYTLPLNLTFTESLMSACKIYDVNGDTDTWSYDSNEKAIRMKYNSTNQADDWFITPPIQVDNVENDFEITIAAKCQGPSYHERFEAFIGDAQTIEAMTIPVLEETEVDMTTYQDYTATVTLPSAGRYYIGIHGTSEKDKFYLFVKNIKMEEIGGQVGVETMTRSAANVQGLRGAIRLGGMAETKVTVCDMAGHVLFNGNAASDNHSIAAAPGLYIVKAHDKTYKVVVR